MMTPSRRDFLKISLGGAGTLLLPGSTFLQAAEPHNEPHFFLMIVLNGGADSSYMFDARPLSMTKAGKIQNYLGQEPSPWIGRNGVSALATSLIKPFVPFRDRFSVLNGVYMTPSFDGHLQNMNFLFTGNAFGGDSFIPHLNLPETGREPTRKRPRSAIPSGVEQRARIARMRSQGLSTPRRTALSKQPPPEISKQAKPAPSSSAASS